MLILWLLFAVANTRSDYHHFLYLSLKSNLGQSHLTQILATLG